VRRAHRSSAVASALLLAACADHTDFSGTYVGHGKGSYRPTNGASAEFTIPDDAVVVTTTGRHYQHSSIEVTAGRCVLRSDSTGGETAWSLAAVRGTCTFDVPSVGAVVLADVSGGLIRNPPTRSARPDSVHLTLTGTADDGSFLSYTMVAKPKQ
jgi:hypothetical protein